MTDIIQWLENWLEQHEPQNVNRLINDAAGEIERLRAEVDRLSRTDDDAQIRRLQAEVEGLRAALYLDVGIAYSTRVLDSHPEEHPPLSEDKKPDDFEELMRRMGQTRQFPIDLQPVNPAAPVEHFSPAKMRKALAEETGMSEDDLRQLAPGFLD